jgi:hypothetical protein
MKKSSPLERGLRVGDDGVRSVLCTKSIYFPHSKHGGVVTISVHCSITPLPQSNERAYSPLVVFGNLATAVCQQFINQIASALLRVSSGTSPSITLYGVSHPASPIHKTPSFPPLPSSKILCSIPLPSGWQNRAMPRGISRLNLYSLRRCITNRGYTIDNERAEPLVRISVIIFKVSSTWTNY